MLSDRERATLDEIQDRLLAEDPRFVRAFKDPLRPSRTALPGKTLLQRADRVLSWGTVALSVLLLMAGSVGGAALVAMLGVALWMARR
jgi:fatty acid desaturase